jgi:hypothetical protein
MEPDAQLIPDEEWLRATLREAMETLGVEGVLDKGNQFRWSPSDLATDLAAFLSERLQQKARGAKRHKKS